MSKDWSRHTRYSERKAPRGRRGRPVYGEREDFRRFYRCPYCNFLIDANETSLPAGPGTPPFMVSLNVADPLDLGPPVMTGDSTSLGSIEEHDDLVAMALNMDGTEKAIVTTYFPQVTGGCPFCGCSSWR